MENMDFRLLEKFITKELENLSPKKSIFHDGMDIYCGTCLGTCWSWHQAKLCRGRLQPTKLNKFSDANFVFRFDAVLKYHLYYSIFVSEKSICLVFMKSLRIILEKI